MTDSDKIKSAILYNEVTLRQRPIAVVAFEMDLATEEATLLLSQYRNYMRSEFYFPLAQWIRQKRKCAALLAPFIELKAQKALNEKRNAQNIVDWAFHMPIKECEDFAFKEIQQQVLNDTYLPESYRASTSNELNLIKNKKLYL